MRDVARDPAVLERLRVQRSRLADRMRPPWWYLAGFAALWALVFAGPFSSRYLPQGVPTWPVLLAAVAVACLLQRGLAWATGISAGIPDLTYRPGRPARIAMLAVSLAAIVTEHFLIGRGLLAAAVAVAALAVAVAALAVAAGVVSVQASLRGIRRELRGGGGAA